MNMQYYYNFINDYEYGYDEGNSTSFESLLSYKYKCEFTDYDRFEESIEGLTGEVTVAAAATAFVVVVLVVVVVVVVVAVAVAVAVAAETATAGGGMEAQNANTSSMHTSSCN